MQGAVIEIETVNVHVDPSLCHSLATPVRPLFGSRSMQKKMPNTLFGGASINSACGYTSTCCYCLPQKSIANLFYLPSTRTSFLPVTENRQPGVGLYHVIQRAQDMLFHGFRQTFDDLHPFCPVSGDLGQGSPFRGNNPRDPSMKTTRQSLFPEILD